MVLANSDDQSLPFEVAASASVFGFLAAGCSVDSSAGAVVVLAPGISLDGALATAFAGWQLPHDGTNGREA